MNSFKWLGIGVSMLLCMGACVYSLSFRYRSEASNKAVILAAEVDQIRVLGAAEGLSLREAVAKLKESGLNGVVASEETVRDLVSGVGPNLATIQLQHQMELPADLPNLTRVNHALQRRFPGVRPDRLGVEDILSTPVGIGPECKELSSEGIDLIVRHANVPGGSDSYVKETLAESASAGARYFLPAGDQVLGRREAMGALYLALEANQMYYASPEFAKIGGDSNVLASRPQRVIRLHAAQAGELDKLSESAAVERYAKAATERNIRILLLRPLTSSSTKPLQSFQHFFAAVRNQLQKEGMTIKSARPFEPPQAPRWAYVAIGLSIAPTVVFVIASLTGKRRLTWPASIAFTLLGILCWFEPGRNYAALAGSITFPVAGMIFADRWNGQVILKYLLISIVSLIGGLVVAGLLNDLQFMVRGDQFSGVKLAHFAPVAAIGAYFFIKLTKASQVIRTPILWSQMILGIVLLTGLAFMASRTGNDNPAGVSGAELQFRELLERSLVVRPRTKEFLIGHPALIIGLAMLTQLKTSERLKERFGGWTALILMVGGIGQTSIVNTLCHLHTPLAIGLTRIAVGLGIGGVLGVFGWMLIRGPLQRLGERP